jgi:hypothetical protein
MADNFDLKKFLIESKALQNLNPILAESKEDNEKMIRERIREIIIAELGPKTSSDDDYDDDDYSDYFFDIDTPEKNIKEAKKKKEEEEEEEVTDTETEDFSMDDEFPAEEAPAEEAPDVDGGLENLAANMEGTESELMKDLMNALKIAKGMDNEKLETQIANTLKFFVGEYIGGENK